MRIAEPVLPWFTARGIVASPTREVNVWSFAQLYGVPVLAIVLAAVFLRRQDSENWPVAIGCGVILAVLYIVWVDWLGHSPLDPANALWLLIMCVAIIALTLVLGALAPWPEDEGEEAFRYP